MRADSNKETITLRCIEPGHRDVGINAVPIASSQEREVDPVRVEVTGLNPQVTVLISSDVALDRVGQTVNVVSLDIDRHGKTTLRDPPIEPITDIYEGAKP